MSAAFDAALNLDGLWLLIAAVIVAGIVRGFSGFGTAMVFMPVAALVVSPVEAMLIMLTFDLFGPLPLVPRALRDGEPRDVGLLGAGALVGLAIGVSLLVLLDPIYFRWAVCILALALLVLLISGWRYRTPLQPWATVLVGWVGGVLGGVAALAGPPVILSYMSSPRGAAAIRANTLLYLILVDALTLILFALKGLITLMPIATAAILIVPYTLASMLGARIFDPDRETLYRWVGYGLIAGAALVGLPLWDG